ncbi:MAG: AcrR family transcriptional regulator [Motiliproteus sp.]|jgi:AcrR family transcriptional regulator
MSESLTKRGRPTDPRLQEARKQDLIDAAYALLRHSSYRRITIRDLANEAGTQSAMIKYYFGDKQGLFLALLERVARQHLSAFEALRSAPDPIKAFIETSLQFFSNNPSIIRLVTDEVLHGDSPLRQAFLDMLPKRMAVLLPQLIVAQQQLGLMRQDLNPKWTAFSLINLILTPFIIAPERKEVWTISDAELCSSHWAAHIYHLFTLGTALGTTAGDRP